VLHQIGAGAVGPVFRAYEPNEDRLVAVKVFRLDLAPENAHRLVGELERLIAAGLTHATVVAPIATGLQGVTPYLAQDYVTADSLDVVLRNHGPAPVGDALRAAGQLATALDVAAAAHVEHGTLHPRDVLLSAEEVRITGLGIARALEQVGVMPPVRRPYAAPERTKGSGWDRRADVFSLAALVYEMLWGRRIATGARTLDALTELDGGNPARLRDVFARALADEPSDRFATATEFVDALNDAFASRSATEETPSASASDDRALVAFAPESLSQQEVISEARVADDRPAFEEADREREETRNAALHVATGETRETGRDAARHPARAADAASEAARHDKTRRTDRRPPMDEPLLPLDAPAMGAPVASAPLDEPSMRAPVAAAPLEPPAVIAPIARVPDLDLRAAEENRYRDVETGPAAASNVDEDAPLPATPRMLDTYETDAAPLTTSRTADHYAADAAAPVTSRVLESYATDAAPRQSGSTSWPLALAVIVGLAVGFASGYLVAVRERAPQIAANETIGAPAAGVSGREFTEGRVTAPIKPSTVESGARAAAAPSRAGDPIARAPLPTKSAVTAVKPDPKNEAAQNNEAAQTKNLKSSARAGQLLVRSRPAGARVFIDGRESGRTPTTVRNLASGAHRVRIVRSGYEPEERRVAIGEARSPASLSIDLARARISSTSTPPTVTPGTAGRFAGLLEVASRPTGAKVFVDGRSIGTTPLGIADLSAGEHVIRLELDGYRRWSSSVRIVANERNRVTASLER